MGTITADGQAQSPGRSSGFGSRGGAALKLTNEIRRYPQPGRAVCAAVRRVVRGRDAVREDVARQRQPVATRGVALYRVGRRPEPHPRHPQIATGDPGKARNRAIRWRDLFRRRARTGSAAGRSLEPDGGHRLALAQRRSGVHRRHRVGGLLGECRSAHRARHACDRRGSCGVERGGRARAERRCGLERRRTRRHPADPRRSRRLPLLGYR